VLGKEFVAEGHHFDAANGEVFILKAVEDVAGEVFLNAIGFEQDESGFCSHGVGIK